MPKLVWDVEGARTYETGVSKGVLYLQSTGQVFDKAVAWSGLTKASEKPEGAETTDLYADNIKYLSMVSAENFKGSIEAYSYPVEFYECDGTAIANKGVLLGQQARKKFCFSYQSIVGNDTKGDGYGVKYHLWYNLTAAPSERENATVNDSPEAATFSWEVSSIPVNVEGYRPVSSLTVDSTKVSHENIKKLEEKLYGSDATGGGGDKTASFPTPAEVIAMFA